VLGWEFRAPVSNQVAQQVAAPPPSVVVASPVAHLAASDPALLKQQIVDELRAAGVEAIGYDRMELSGVDARVPQPLTSGVRGVLDKYGIPPPSDGLLRVEITRATLE